MRTRTKRLLFYPLFVALMLAPLASVAAYTPNTDSDGNELEPNPVLKGNVTISNHKPDCDTDVLCYYDDSNNRKSLVDSGFSLNPDVAEPIQIMPQRVDCQYYAEDASSDAAKLNTGAWCANVSNKAWLDTAQWTTSSTEGNDTFERVMRNGAHALHFANNRVDTTQDTDTYTLDFTDLTTDVSKMRFILGVEIVANHNAVYVDIYDGNLTGYERFALSGASFNKADGTTYYLANSTGIVFWDELVSEGDATQGGVTDDIGKIVINVYPETTSAIDFYVYALALQVKRHEFGTDENSDPVYNMTYKGCDGKDHSTPLGYACLTTLGPNFQYQNIKDLKVAYWQDAAALADEDVTVINQEIADDAYTWKGNYRFTYHLPKMIDLTYVDEKVDYRLPVAGKQHEVVKANGVDKLNDVNKKAAGAEVTLLSSPPIGKDFEVEFSVMYTEAQMLSITDVGFLGLSPSNPFSKVWVWLSALAGIGFVFARALRRRRKA